ncbi:hypothetical protein BJ170DRAFT_629269 [Xylariales sp. AK1849]|nr:hypothetical protein BJ170DRAFT_629269 [Xylariales sp. AK1849]
MPRQHLIVTTKMLQLSLPTSMVFALLLRYIFAAPVDGPQADRASPRPIQPELKQTSHQHPQARKLEECLVHDSRLPDDWVCHHDEHSMPDGIDRSPRSWLQASESDLVLSGTTQSTITTAFFEHINPTESPGVIVYTVTYTMEVLADAMVCETETVTAAGPSVIAVATPKVEGAKAVNLDGPTDSVLVTVDVTATTTTTLNVVVTVTLDVPPPTPEPVTSTPEPPPAIADTFTSIPASGSLTVTHGGF